ncbi:MAG: hypothetical protein ACREN5_03210 [Gemmatimonadales bacterium]
MTYGFSLDVAASESDEVTLGGLWAPGVVEGLYIQSDVGPIVMRAWAVFGREVFRQAVVTAFSVRGQVLLPLATDQPAAIGQGWLYNATPRPLVVPVQVDVPWAPWWLRLSIDNYGAAVARVVGSWTVRLREPADGMVVPAFYGRAPPPHQVREASHGNPVEVGIPEKRGRVPWRPLYTLNLWQRLRERESARERM